MYSILGVLLVAALIVTQLYIMLLIEKLQLTDFSWTFKDGLCFLIKSASATFFNSVCSLCQEFWSFHDILGCALTLGNV